MSAGLAEPIAVLGAGSWGTALAVLLARNGQAVRLWGNEPEHIAELVTERVNNAFLPDILLPDGIAPSSSLAECLDGVRDVLIVVPSHAFRAVLERVLEIGVTDLRLLWATKGLEPGSSRPLHEVVTELLSAEQPMALLSGPTFAREVALDLPAAVTLAANQTVFADDLVKRFHNDHFRVYTTDDICGVEIGGAVKNVLAIATGIADGLDFGANTRAAIVTRGLAEMMRLGVALGGRRETFMGLAGLGDLVLTCTDDQSRNRRLGLALARGLGLDEAMNEIGQVVEGVATAQEVMQLATRHAIEMPIVSQVYKVLYENKDVGHAVKDLLTRQPKTELA